MDRVSALIDRDGFRSRLTQLSPDWADATIAINETLTGTSMVATKLCGWMSQVQDYKFLRLRTVDGHLRAVMRRTTGLGATYHELELTRSRDDGLVRVADVYSYFKGEWLSEEIAETMKALSNHAIARASVKGIQKARTLGDSQPAEALAILDELPPPMRGLRSIQGWRVKLAQEISTDEYSKALEELFRRFPNDPSVALLQVDREYLRGNFTVALQLIDIVDATVGPDPFLDGTRAMMLAARRAPGDLDLADAKAENAMRAEPRLQIGSWARMSVALARHEWKKALEQLEALSQRFGVSLQEAALRSTPMLKELLQTPEYAAWQAKHP